jgi:hypothetical protein
MGGTPRRAVLFEGPPGTGKTTWPRPWHARPACPFLFVSSSAFQSMYYGQTNRKIRSYFRRLRVAARREGGPSGSSRRSTPSAAPRRMGGWRPARGGQWRRERAAGPAAELRRAAAGTKLRAPSSTFEPLPPHGRQLAEARPDAGQRPRARATNRAADLDPALLRRDASTGPSTSACRAGRTAGDHRPLPRPQGARADLDRAERRSTLGRHDRRLLSR